MFNIGKGGSSVVDIVMVTNNFCIKVFLFFPLRL